MPGDTPPPSQNLFLDEFHGLSCLSVPFDKADQSLFTTRFFGSFSLSLPHRITAPVGLGEQSRGFVHDDHVAVPEQDVV